MNFKFNYFVRHVRWEFFDKSFPPDNVTPVHLINVMPSDPPSQLQYSIIISL
jgi:hypothetical protein